ALKGNTMDKIRHDWSREEIKTIYQTPLLELILRAADVHRQYHELGEVQISSLISIKTGGCPEDCDECVRGARYDSDIRVHGKMPVEAVVYKARKAKAAGAQRMCLGACWRVVHDNLHYDCFIEMIKEINQ